jgi:hypothetical protein
VTAGQATVTGSILGMAWDPASRRVYNTAYVRRHASMYESDGKARPGALFVTTPGAGGLGGSTSFLVDLEDLLPGTSSRTPTGAAGDAGHVPTNAERQLDCIEHKTAAQSADPCYQKGADSNIAPAGQVGVYGMVGQVGIGEIEVDGEREPLRRLALRQEPLPHPDADGRLRADHDDVARRHHRRRQLHQR